MTKVIEIVVVGDTGSGKSHVLDLLARALRAEYGIHAQITSHELSLERGLGHELLKPRIGDTIFNLREQGSASSSKNGEMKISVDTSELVSILDRAEAIHGQVVSAALDPLEQAIQCTAQVMRDEREAMTELCKRLDQGMQASSLHDRMGRHLDQLLAEQLKRMATDETL